MAKRLPEASSVPSSAGIAASGADSTFSWVFFSVTQRLRGENVQNPCLSAAKKLFALELRLPLLQKGSRAFGLVCCGAAHTKQRRFEI